MTDPQNVLLAQGAIGAEAEEFLRSDLGKTVLGLARQEAMTALSKLRTTLCWRSRKIRELQNVVWRAEAFEGWLKTLIAQGQQSLREYDRRQETITEDYEDGTSHPDAE